MEFLIVTYKTINIVSGREEYTFAFLINGDSPDASDRCILKCFGSEAGAPAGQDQGQA